MNKDILRGLIAGIVLAVIVGYGVLYAMNLNIRVSSIEKFLNQQIQQQAQRPPVPEVNPPVPEAKGK